MTGLLNVTNSSAYKWTAVQLKTLVIKIASQILLNIPHTECTIMQSIFFFLHGPFLDKWDEYKSELHVIK